MRTASARDKHWQAIGGFHALHKHFDFITRLNRNLAILGKFGGVNDAFGLIAKIDDYSAFANTDDSSANNFALLEGRLFLLKLIKKLSEIDVADLERDSSASSALLDAAAGSVDCNCNGGACGVALVLAGG